MAIESLPAGFAAISPIFEYMRPRRSPYLIPSLVGAILVQQFVSGGPYADGSAWLFLLPTGAAFALFGFLALRYRDPTLDRKGVLTDEDVNSEIDGQLKFARAMGIAVAMWGIFYISWHSSWNGIASTIAYIACLVHLGTFFTYMILYNIRVEDPRAYAFFQIAALSSTCLVIVLLSAVQVSSKDGDWLYRCSTTFEYTGLVQQDTGEPVVDTRQSDSEACNSPVAEASDFNADEANFDSKLVQTISSNREIDGAVVVSVFFLLLWAYLESFWVGFFVRAIRVSVTVISDAAVKDRVRHQP